MFPYEKICRFPSASPLDKLVFYGKLKMVLPPVQTGQNRRKHTKKSAEKSSGTAEKGDV